MTNETIARNYASTLFELAQRQEGLDAFAQALDGVVGLMDQNPSFRLFLETPRISDGEKKDLLKKVFADAVPRTFLNFLQVMIDKRRQRILGTVAEEFHLLLDEHLGRTHVTVTVARDLGQDAMDELSRKLTELLGKEAIPHVRVKPAILGGVHLKTGDTVYDGTLRRRIKQLRRRMVAAELPDIDFTTSGEASDDESEITS